MKETNVKQIVLQVGGRDIALTPQEAEKLYEALGGLFAKKEVVERVIHEHRHDWYWRYPVVTWGSDTTAEWRFDPRPGTIYCKV